MVLFACGVIPQFADCTPAELLHPSVPGVTAVDGQDIGQALHLIQSEVDQGILRLNAVNIGGTDKGNSPSAANQAERGGETGRLYHPAGGKIVVTAGDFCGHPHILPGAQNNKSL